MLRLNKMTDYSVLILVFMAKTARLQTTQRIADNTHLPKPTVSKLVKRLVQAGILQSERGVNGGYSLSCPSNAITIADVIAAIEERQGLTACASANDECHLQTHCALSGHWPQVDAAIRHALNQVTIAALTQSATQFAQGLQASGEVI